jgi:hypothetical protein
MAAMNVVEASIPERLKAPSVMTESAERKNTLSTSNRNWVSHGDIQENSDKSDTCAMTLPAKFRTVDGPTFRNERPLLREKA